MAGESQDDVRAAELRHRTANTFQLISALARMRGQRSGEPEARRQLLWMAEAIGALGALERYRQEARVDFQAYLAEMAGVWRRRQGAAPVEIVVDAAPMLVPDHVASTLALVAHELVANALTHGCNGAPGRIAVSLAAMPDGRSQLVVGDDGPGFNPAAPEERERFGLWFVRSLALQVRGELELRTGPGVRAQLSFPTPD